MDTKIVYQTDHLGIYTGKTVADRSPLEPDVWLIPGGCVEVAPPAVPEKRPLFGMVENGSWLTPIWD
ncbi:hypothetical protein ACIPV9_05585 [Pseudomonas psychrophila]|uniref:hypothetical protein n=1 Tax=Pseudomonas psychrophila TaxID=122355 RepID=UPI0038087DDF